MGWADRLRTEWPFAAALAGAVVVRVVVWVAFPPAFVFSDGPTYLGLVDHLAPSPDRPVGYGVLLWLLASVSRGVALVAGVQAVLGLATAVLAYALLRRREVRPVVATLGVLPLLYDEMQLVLEHSVLSDPLFVLLVVGALALLAWWPVPRAWATAVAGLLLGLATVVRLVGEPLVVVCLVFVLVAAASWRSRLVQGLLLVVAFAVPVASYAAWYDAHHGSYALTESSGRALYMRTTSFVDCARLTLPAYERPLCPREPVGQRLDPTDYGWHLPRVLHLRTPPGVTRDRAMRDFARRAIRAQPWDYVRVVARDVAMGFWAPTRENHYDYDTAYKWQFSHYVDYQPTGWTRPAYADHGGQQPSTRQPWASYLVWYGRHVYLPGPLLGLLLVLVAAGCVVRRGGRDRPVVLLLAVSGLAMAIEPDVTAEFVWRYQMPLITLLPLAAALAGTRLRSPSG